MAVNGGIARRRCHFGYFDKDSVGGVQAANLMQVTRLHASDHSDGLPFLHHTATSRCDCQEEEEEEGPQVPATWLQYRWNLRNMRRAWLARGKKNLTWS